MRSTVRNLSEHHARSRRRLRVATCMAPNADAMCRELATYLAHELDLAVELVDDVPWDARERLFDAGEIDLCWICGLPYVEKFDAGHDIEVCVAPVMRSQRYDGRPVYFSDVLVRADTSYTCLQDLCGETWAYNEPRSHSGYNVVRYHLALLGHTLDYFGTLIEAGSHQTAIELIATGQATAAAVDSTVFEAEARRRPDLFRKLRAIDTLGPSPSPPWVFSRAVTPELRTSVRRCLSNMHRTGAGATVLAGWNIAELCCVDDAAYDPIRRMTRTALAMTDSDSPLGP